MLGKRLRMARALRNMTQMELGIKAGFDEETASSRISHYENEVHATDYAAACRIADALEIPEAYLYARDEALAALILQYHEAKIEYPGSLVIFTPYTDPKKKS